MLLKHLQKTLFYLTMLLLLVVQQSIAGSSSSSVSGYLLYCPCMGRFGNQAEQFLGALAFAKELQRTLVVPPWITYNAPGQGINLVPFSLYFNISLLNDAHPTLDMKQFMDKLASVVWPVGSRTVICHSPRDDGTCQAKKGNPFGPFWDAFGVTFDRHEFYIDTVGSLLGKPSEWRRIYPGAKWPVLAFISAPASFPAQMEHLGLHRHMAFNADYLQSVEDLMAAHNMQRPILGIHLRNNVDFVGACQRLVPQLPKTAGLFSSYQCFGPSSKLGQLSLLTCMPDDPLILSDVARVAKSAGIRTVFVATDYDAKLSLMKEAAPDAGLFFSTKTLGTDVFQDVALLSLADEVLLNCASSLSAFVRRNRDSAGRASGYLGLGGRSGWRHDEL